MKTVLIFIFDLGVVLPFAIYIVHAALNVKSISPGFIKAYGALLITVFGLSLASLSLDGVELMGPLRVSLRGFGSWKLW
jgi:hypothetical protein